MYCLYLLRLIYNHIRFRFMKNKLFDQITPKKIIGLDTNDPDNLVPTAKIDLGFAATKTVATLKSEGKLSDRQVFELRMETKAFLICLVEKVKTKSPIQYSLCRNLSCLAPKSFNEESDTTASKKMTSILRIVEETGWVAADKCDTVKRQFLDFRQQLNSDPSEKQVLTNFTPGIDRLDVFYSERLASNNEKKELWSFLSKLLVLSHGQATVERSFSENKEVSCTNLSEKALVAKRCISSYVRQVSLINIYYF